MDEIIRILHRTNELEDRELGAFLREEGVHTSQLKQWREAFRTAIGKPSREQRKREARDRKRIKRLEKELRRKESALAEAAALLWLKKKAQAIWGDEDDDTPSRNGE